MEDIKSETTFTLGNWTATRLHDQGIWHVGADNHHDLAMLFWRVQEFYESASDNVRGKAFSLAEYIDWYAKNASEEKAFTYTEDWSGFNVPSNSILASRSIGHPDLNLWDKAFGEIFDEMVRRQGNNKIYLIGSLFSDIESLDHEFAHGLYYIDHNYREKQKAQVAALPNEARDHLFKILRTVQGGYAEKVLVDEAQAFLSTGLDERMEDMEKYTRPFIMTFHAALKPHKRSSPKP